MEEVRKVVEALMKVGPRFTDIARAAGVPVSTVRYILLKKLPKLGLTIRASVNYGMLGLQRYLVEFRSSHPPHHISTILDLMGESMYLDYYTYLMTEKKFLAIFAIPPKYEKDFLDFLRTAELLDLIEDVNVWKLAYMRPLPFMSDFFDFSRGVWIQDWMNRPRKREVPEIPEYPETDPRVDKIDLMIISELQKNAISIKYVNLAQKLKLSRQTISRHYEHVRKLINHFAIFWVPHMDPQLLILPLIVRVKAREDYRSLLLSIPFSHAEFRTDRGEYFVMLIIPNVGLYTTLKFITGAINIKSIDFQDMEYSGKFTIQYKLFGRSGWINIFDKAVDKLVEVARLYSRGNSIKSGGKL